MTKQVSSSAGVQVCMPDQTDQLAHLNQSISILHRKTRNSYFVPMLDEVCLARYNEECLFYSVRILQEESPSMLLVSFVDYGNQTAIRLADLQHMRQDFGVLLFQAVRCALAGVGPADASGMWSRAVQELFGRPECLVARVACGHQLYKSSLECLVARVAYKATTCTSSEPKLIELFDQTLIELFDQTLIELFDQTLIELFDQTLIELFDQTQPLSCLIRHNH